MAITNGKIGISNRSNKTEKKLGKPNTSSLEKDNSNASAVEVSKTKENDKVKPMSLFGSAKKKEQPKLGKSNKSEESESTAPKKEASKLVAPKKTASKLVAPKQESPVATDNDLSGHKTKLLGSQKTSKSAETPQATNANSKVQMRHRRVRDEELKIEETNNDVFSIDEVEENLNESLSFYQDDQDYTFDELGNIVRRSDLEKMRESEDNSNVNLNDSDITKSSKNLLDEIWGSPDEQVSFDDFDKNGKPIEKKVTEEPFEPQEEEEDAEEDFEDEDEIEDQEDIQPSETFDSEITDTLEVNSEIFEESNEEEYVNTMTDFDDTENEFTKYSAPAKSNDSDSSIGKSLDGIKGEKVDIISELTTVTEKYLNGRGDENNLDFQIIYNPDCKDTVKPFSINTVAMPNSKVYVNGKNKHWDKAMEVKVGKDNKIELDIGCSLILPSNYGIRLNTNEKLLEKFGLELAPGQQKTFTNAEAAYGFTVSFIGKCSTSYVARFQPLVFCEIIKTN